MALGLLTLELYIPLAESLKDKRSVVKPLLARLHREFNVSTCESDARDDWTRAVVEVACVSQNSSAAHSLLQKVANDVESWRLDAELLDYTIEMVG